MSLIPVRQFFSLIWEKLQFGGDSPNALETEDSAGAESPELDCSGASNIVLSIEYSANNVEAEFRIILLDGNSSQKGRTYSVPFTPGNTGENDDIRTASHFYGEGYTIPTYGAKKHIVLLNTVPTNGGTVSVWSKAV